MRPLVDVWLHPSRIQLARKRAIPQCRYPDRPPRHFPEAFAVRAPTELALERWRLNGRMTALT